MRLKITLATVLCIAVTNGAVSASAQTSPAVADVTTETFQDWIVRCARAPDPTPEAEAGANADGPKTVCEMTQELKDTASGKRVLAIGIQRTDSGEAAMTIVAPLGVKLSAGLLLKGDKDLSIATSFNICLPDGCIVRQSLDSAAITGLSATTSLTASMAVPDGDAFNVNLSPKGFADAWNRLQKISQ